MNDFADKIDELGISQAHFQAVMRVFNRKPPTDSTLSQWYKQHRPANECAIALLQAMLEYPEMRDDINRRVAAQGRGK